jgi:hypothetical protein
MFDKILYLGSSPSVRIILALSTSVKDMTFLPISEVSTQSKAISVLSATRSRNVLLVDLTEANHLPNSNEFNSLLESTVDLYKEGLVIFSESKALGSLLGAVVHGMLRVFRREAESHTAAWCLDLPDALDDRVGEIVLKEIRVHEKGLFSDTFVSYREHASKESICRLVPTLLPIELATNTPPPAGSTVVVGLSPSDWQLLSLKLEFVKLSS